MFAQTIRSPVSFRSCLEPILRQLRLSCILQLQVILLSCNHTVGNLASLLCTESASQQSRYRKPSAEPIQIYNVAGIVIPKSCSTGDQFGNSLTSLTGQRYKSQFLLQEVRTCLMILLKCHLANSTLLAGKSSRPVPDSPSGHTSPSSLFPIVNVNLLIK